MKNFKVLVATSLACVLDVGVVYGSQLKNEVFSSCSGSLPFACFRYYNSSSDNDSLVLHTSATNTISDGWISYKGNSLNPNVFGSLDDFDGQYIPKNGFNFLRIVNSGATLVFGDIQDRLKLHYPFQVGLYVDVVKMDGGRRIQLDSIYGLIVGNIVVASSTSTRVADQKNEILRKEDKKIATFIFDGNGTVNYHDLMRLEKLKSGYSMNAIRNIDTPLAFLGGVWNDSGEEVLLDFRNGARMMGDLYVEGKGSKITVFFDEKRGVLSGLSKNRNSLSSIFEGGIYSCVGQIEISVKEGSLDVRSLSFGDYGIVAEASGKNTLVFTGGKDEKTWNLFQSISPQSLFATQIKASFLGENNVVFRNSSGVGNLIQIGEIFAENGKNFILSEFGGKVNLEVEKFMIAGGEGSPSKNIVILDGVATIGRIVLFDEKLNNQNHFGIVARHGGENIVRLKETKAEEGEIFGVIGLKSLSQYKKERMLATSHVYAWDSGRNDIDTDGDFVLIHREDNERVIGGRIVAGNGGCNTIVTRGGFFSIGYKKSNDILLNRTPNVMEKYMGSTDAIKTLIFVDGGSSFSKNEIKVINSEKKDLSLGDIVAYSGINEVILHGGLFEAGKKTLVGVEKIFAGSREISGVTYAGINDIEINGGSNIVIRQVVTTTGGKNVITVFNKDSKNTSTIQLVKISKIIYSSSGLTSFSFSGAESNGNPIANSSVTLDFNSPFETKEVALELLNIRNGLSIYYISIETGMFYGDVKYGWLADNFDKNEKSKERQPEVNYILQDRSAFVGRIFSENPDTFVSKTVTNGILFLGDGSKFFLKNSGDIGFKTLVLSNSLYPNNNVLQDTIDLFGTVLDLATNGESFSGFARSDFGKTLDIGTLILNASNKNEGNVPLLRFYAGGQAQTQVDQIKVTKLNNGENTSNSIVINGVYEHSRDTRMGNSIKIDKIVHSLDAQVFLPTSLIGYDFTDDHVAILTVSNGGENLNVTSREAQTGFTTYKVDIVKVEEENKETSRAKRSSSSSSPSSKSHRWELGKTLDAKINPNSTKHAGSILTHNPSAWTTVLNSLNKRMGELRDNPYSQGVWARVFGGEQTSKHADIKINSGYANLQGGYDYVFSFDSAFLSPSLNYLGFAFSYGFMNSTSDEFIGGGVFNAPYAYHAVSHTVELGLYDVYLHSSGFYSDSIVKVGYITTDFQGINAHSSFAKVSNCYITLGEEVGYQFKLGEKQEWMITPQVEVIYGYLSESHAKQEFQGQTLHSVLDGIHTLRTRFGSDFTYRLKRKQQVYDFRIGLSYEFDYANASANYGVVGATYLERVEHKSLISTDQRLVVNVGSNMQLHDQVRLYVDLESSYGGKVNTKYQVSVGARYSFGEKRDIVYPREEKINLPLKIGREGGSNDYKY